MIDLSLFGTDEIIIICLIIAETFFLLKELYIVSHHGKLIIKVAEKRGLISLWMAILVIWCVFLFYNIRYVHYINAFRKSILIFLSGIEIAILSIMDLKRYSEIRENGIYIFPNFYRWYKVQSYKWISLNIVEFRVTSIFKRTINLKLTIDKLDAKSDIDEILHKYITL